jgi:hypothetical protein
MLINTRDISSIVIEIGCLTPRLILAPGSVTSIFSAANLSFFWSSFKDLNLFSNIPSISALTELAAFPNSLRSSGLREPIERSISVRLPFFPSSFTLISSVSAIEEAFNNCSFASCKIFFN